MQKQECLPDSTKPMKNQTSTLIPPCITPTSGKTDFPSKIDFVEWLKGLSNHERYLAVQVKAPKVVSLMRKSFTRIEEDRFLESTKLIIQHEQKGKFFHKNVKTFVDGLVFVSSQYHLDSVGFDFNLVDCPERIYDLLTFFNEQETKKIQENIHNKYQFETLTNREEWVSEVARFFRKHLSKMCSTWNPQILEDEKYKKIEYSFFWKNLSPSEKLKLLYLDCFDEKQLNLKLIDMDIPLHPAHLEKEIEDLLKIEKNDFCNRIFKSKLKKSDLKMSSYHGLIYNRWKELVEKSRKKRSKKHQKKKTKKTRNPSLGGYSNQTNETQYKEQQFDIKIQQISMKKLQKDIIECADWISQNANKYFQRRVLAFERVQNFLKLYNFNTKLYGSCAAGMTIENSDVDMALDSRILSFYEHLPSIRDQLEASLQFLSSIFLYVPWIIDVKFIKTAKIPLIKLIIDTEIPIKEDYFSEGYRHYLNRPIKNGGNVSIDLTIEVQNQDSSTCHLGIISTETIKQWLSQIPTLRTVVLILKYHLARRELNQTYLSGLNTYALIVMVIAYLAEAKLTQEKNVAIVLMNLLNFYGWEFDEKIHKIDLLSKDIFTQKNDKNNEKCAAIEIMDPLQEGRNITRNCYRFDEIKQMMRELSKTCINRTINEVEELCWNPKKYPRTSDHLYDLIIFRDNHFISQLN